MLKQPLLLLITLVIMKAAPSKTMANKREESRSSNSFAVDRAPAWPRSCNLSFYPQTEAGIKRSYSKSEPGNESACSELCSGSSRCGMYQWNGKKCDLYQSSLQLVAEVTGRGERELMINNSAIYIGSKKCEDLEYDAGHCSDYRFKSDSQYPKTSSLFIFYKNFSLEQCQALCTTYSNCKSLLYANKKATCYFFSSTDLVNNGANFTLHERLCGEKPYNPDYHRCGQTISAKTTTLQPTDVWTIQVHPYEVTFNESSQICQNRGLNLFHIRSASDLQAVKLLRGRKISSDDVYWIGMSRSSNADEWKWLDDQTAVFNPEAGEVWVSPDSKINTTENFLCGAFSTKELKVTSGTCSLPQEPNAHRMPFMCSGEGVTPGSTPIGSSTQPAGIWTLQVNDYRATFSQARKICQDQGLHLLHIHTERKGELYPGVKLADMTDYWIGIYRPCGDDAWEWTDDNAPVFGSGPGRIFNIEKGPSFHKPDLMCGILRTGEHNFTVAATDCARELFFICTDN